MTYVEYIQYHLGGDAGVEERMIASLAAHFRLSRWDSFRLAYYYTTTYHIPSALMLLRNHNTPKSALKFRTPINEEAQFFWLKMGAKIIDVKGTDYEMQIKIIK